MNNRRSFLKRAGVLAVAARSRAADQTADSIVIQNAEVRLIISSNGIAQSLVHKPSGQECLAKSPVPVFSVTQLRPYDNELQLSFPAKPKEFPVENVRMEGDRLLVRFALVGYDAVIRLKITESYIGFTLESLTYKLDTSLRTKRSTPLDEAVFLQLPVRNRKNFGEWLNVMWDDAIAVNLLATGPSTRIDSETRDDHRILRAGAVDSVQMEGVGAALVTTSTSRLLDRIAKVEEDFGLPRGVESRRNKTYSESYYELLTTSPQELDQHIRYAKMAGLRTMDVYYRIFASTAGHFTIRPEFPNGLPDVRRMVNRIKQAGILPGIHIHYNKADKTDSYVSPRPDPRLNLAASFTLKKQLDAVAVTIEVEESPHDCPMDEGRRILKIQDELISYERYTVRPPYQFIGCQRAFLETRPASYIPGTRVGLLDVDTWPIFVRFTQDTDIQEEVATRLGEIYRAAGFKFVYFDGAEDVPGPQYWYTVSRAQWLVYQALRPSPVFAEGACKSHFSWHILTRGNAFDVFKPEAMKQATRQYPAPEAAEVAKDFTRINFGWIGYWAPGANTIGTQPDMIEYVTSRAAGWDCPISLVGDLPQLNAHPRTPDNLEVIRRWEDVRARNWLSPLQKSQLRDLNQEHILLIDEQGNYELASCREIPGVAGGAISARAFTFERQNKRYAVFWHASGTATLELHLSRRDVRLMAQIGKEIPMEEASGRIRVPLAGRLFLECRNLSQDQLTAAFQTANPVKDS